MSGLLLKGGRVIDPSRNLDGIRDVFLDRGSIVSVGEGLEPPSGSSTAVVDVSGLVVCPGLIDMHASLREPGQTAKEDIASGTAAAARGGFTSVLCMPNTSPVMDSASTVALVQQLGQRKGKVNVWAAGAITLGLSGEELAPIGGLVSAGVRAICDGGRAIANSEMMRRALEYVHQFDLPVLTHCQEESLVAGGMMHEGRTSAILGLRGWPAVGEEIQMARDIRLAELTGTRLHIQHVSTAAGVQLVASAREKGLAVTAEACPHHFTLTDTAIAGSHAFWSRDGQGLLAHEGEDWQEALQWSAYDTHFKMYPPLRTAEDREALLRGVADGTLSVIASDHAPHCAFEKEVEFDYAPFGVAGLETCLALALGQLYHSGRMSLMDVLARLTSGPESILRLGRGSLAPGAPADVLVLDPDHAWKLTPEASLSKGGNNPFYHWPLRGAALWTISQGREAWRLPEWQPKAENLTFFLSQTDGQG